MERDDSRGIALVAVLWILALLAIIAGSFTTDTRTNVKLAYNLVENAKARALADAGVNRAILALPTVREDLKFGGEIEALLENRQGIREALLSRPEVQEALRQRAELEPVEVRSAEADSVWRTDGTIYVWDFAGGTALISIQDEAGKVDLNLAPDELIKGLFVSLGTEEKQAATLVDAIADFRDEDDLTRLNGAEDDDYRAAGLAWEAKDAPFEAVAELRQVIGMTRELYDRVAPYLTVYSWQGRIDPATAPEAVLRAIPGIDDVAVGALLDARSDAEGAPGAFTVLTGVEQYVGPSRGGVFTIRAEAVTQSGAHYVREAVVGLTPNHPRPFRIQAWRQGKRPEAPSEEEETN